ncbi:Rab-like protein 2B [Mizuhopecten yessoensis]|uniref:Rab-like protein 2B n=1 Tax=Mizuhopecten yessoensis TaxID=6573 RepID=A0A210QPH6_MIZYE|nr:Rab-like protein 2B [Mizuhopecten yessoensis]
MANVAPDYDKAGDGEDVKVKVICLGDSAVGKSKLVERFLMDGYKPQQLSTFALTLFNYETEVNNQKVSVDFWDTAGQERFNNMHPSYYHQAHACILVFDSTRKVTYKNLSNWLKELQEYRPEIPCLVAGNKIDDVLQMFMYVTDVYMFKDAIRAAVAYKSDSTDFMDEIMRELENFELETEQKDSGLESEGNSEDKEEGNKDKTDS